MNLKNFIGIGLGLAAAVATAVSHAAPADASKQFMTQGELAKRIAFISGVADGIRAPVTGEDAASALSGRGWAPIEGWRVGAVATKEDFYVVMAKYLGLTAKNPNDPKSYLEALTLAGFAFGDEKKAPKALEDRDKAISKLVLEVKGEAQFRQGADGAWAKLGKLQIVQEGMSFRTGKESHVDVVYTKGAAQRIEENSEVTVEMLREETVGGQPIRAVVVYIAQGEVMSLVEPMNSASQFVLRDASGKFEVDRASGCTFAASVTDDQSLTLNSREIRMARGLRTLVEIQDRDRDVGGIVGFGDRSRGGIHSTSLTVMKGAGSFVFGRGGSLSTLRVGANETMHFTPGNLGEMPKPPKVFPTAENDGLNGLVQRLQNAKNALRNRTVPSSDLENMLPGDLTTLLGDMNGTGIVNKRVTPSS